MVDGQEQTTAEVKAISQSMLKEAEPVTSSPVMSLPDEETILTSVSPVMSIGERPHSSESDQSL